MRRPGPTVAVPLAVVAAVLGLLLLRLARQPMDPYGTNGAEYIEHAQRLRWHGELRGLLERPGLPSLSDAIAALDGSFPPGLYAWGDAVGAVVGHRAEAVATAGLGWWLLLLAALWVAARSLAGDGRAAAAAVAAGALVPALHGSAIRYYFDLPMTAAIWASVAALLRWQDRRPVAAGLAAGALALAATTLKWTAVPALLPLLPLAAASTTATGRPTRRRAVALGIALGIWGAGVGAWLGAARGPTSLHRMADEAAVAELARDRGGDLRPAGPLATAAAIAGRLVHPGRPRGATARAGWYAVKWASAVLSPLLAVLAAPLVVTWWRGGRRGGWLLVAGPVPYLLFLLLVVLPIDDRFLLPVAPAAALLAALGWSSAGPDFRRRWGAVLVAAGLLVALDLHHLPRTPLTAEAALHPPPGPLMPPRGMPYFDPVVRGAGAASSVERRGWGRADEAPPDRAALRREVLEWIRRCEPARVGLPDRRRVIGPHGDSTWLSYELLLRHRREGIAPATRVDVVDPRGAGLTESPGAAVLLPAGEPWPEAWAGAWRPDREIADPDGGPGVAIWTLDGAGPCRTSAPRPSP